VFSVDGRRLKTLASGVQEVGLYQMRWDGTDERGQALRSGVFYIRFDAAGKRQTRTITLVR
jgi:flagellar hook assembly protein FlgD